MVIKTRINTNTKASRAAQQIGGFSFRDLVKARKGNKAVLKRLYATYREGKIAEVAMPLIEETIRTKVKSEKDWNQFVSQYIKDGSQAALLVEGAKNEASFANAKFVHGTQELKEKFQSTWEVEKDRHKFTIDYNRAKLFADLVIQQVEGEAKLFEQGARVRAKQVSADNDFELKEIEMISQYGDDGLELIRKRDYLNDESGLSRIFVRIKNGLGL